MIYKCKNCGGNAVYHPGKHTLYCPNCDSIDSADEVRGGEETQCPNCGAPLNIKGLTTACRCEHCGSYIILEQRLQGDYRPHLVLPFMISKEDAVQKLQDEFVKRFFTPGSFLSNATLEKMEGSYVPFFMYSYQANMDYHGTGTKVRVWHSGNTEYRETSFYRIDRNMDIDFVRIPVDASAAMPDRLMDLLEPYAYGALEEFQTKYLSGFMSDSYDEEPAELENRAKTKARNDSEQLLQDSISGYTSVHADQKNLRMDSKGTEYALLPVWIYHYEYHGNRYDYYVNGQTGKILGKTPVAKGKVFAYSAAIWALLSAFLVFGKMFLEVL